MPVDIKLAWSLEQILRSQLMKRLSEVFDAEGEQTMSKSSITTAKKVPWQCQRYYTLTVQKRFHCLTSACVPNMYTHFLAGLEQRGPRYKRMLYADMVYIWQISGLNTWKTNHMAILFIFRSAPVIIWVPCDSLEQIRSIQAKHPSTRRPESVVFKFSR